MHFLQMQVKEYLNFPHFDYQQVSYWNSNYMLLL
jgi:hypothetical protein